MELRKSLRRKFSGGNIRSPIVRRNNQAEVVIKGWLFKLEGATIKQWRKRWCILSEYCLFYYKGSEEEKCLGSILLPSFKIRQCTTEDKVSLKHSFVAEHQNTKSYYFAAENSASMCQWMNAMSLASVMQRETQPGSRPEQQRHRHQPQVFLPGYDGAVAPHHPQPPTLRPSDESFEVEAYAAGSREYLGSGDQYPCSYTHSPIYDRHPNTVATKTGPYHPVYANAPPKPLRHGTMSPPPPAEGCYEGYGGGYEGYESYYGHQEQLPAYAGRPRSAHYGDRVTATSAAVLMRPRSADFLERDDDDDVGEFRYGRAAGRLRPKSSMAQCGWEDEGYDEDEEWRASALATTPAHVTTTARHGSYGEPQQPTTSSGGAGTTQNRKVAHKEESMKRLLEWKQRMLQSPLRKKQGQHLVPSSLEFAALKRLAHTVSGDPSIPPERPPLPEEYRKRIPDQVHASSAGDRFQSHNLSGIEQLQFGPGPDLIQHTKSLPSRVDDCPDYVNLRNLQCAHLVPERDVEHSVKAPSQSYQPRRSCLSPTNRSKPDVPEFSLNDPQPPPPKQWSQPPLRLTEESNDSGAPGYSRQVLRSKEFKDPRSCTLPFVHTKGEESHDDVCSNRSLSPTNALVQRGNQRHLTSGCTLGYGEQPENLHAEQPQRDCKTRINCLSPGPALGKPAIPGEHEETSPKVIQNLVPSRPPSVLRKPANQGITNSLKTQGEAASKLDLQPTNRDSMSPVRGPSLKTLQRSSTQDALYSNSSAWNKKMMEEGEVGDSLHSPHSREETLRKANVEGFYIKKEDYYRASQMIYSKQASSKSLLHSPSDTGSTSSCPTEVETFDSRYRRTTNTLKSPQWELDKDIGLPLPDNLDVSFQSTSNNSVFEAPGEGQTPGDQSPELFHGTLRPSRTYVRDHQPQKDLPKLPGCSEGKGNDEMVAKTSLGSSNIQELRSAFQKKKEAPPPNIVQDRIKCFESKDDPGARHLGNAKETWEALDKKCGSDANVSTYNQERSQKDAFYAESMLEQPKMECLPQYNPSLLADVHQSADFKKKTLQRLDDISAPLNSSRQTALNLAVSSSLPTSMPVQHRSPEAHYVAMGGWLEREADYVSMNIDLAPAAPLEEPVYNEPILPVQSFLHDSFGKMRSLAHPTSKHDSSGMSSDGSTENIYEQLHQGNEEPTAVTLSSSCNAARDITETEEPPVYEEPYGLGSTPASESITEIPKGLEAFAKDGLKQAAKKPIPDLLHHEEIKDSGASDADDEASRADFDTPCSSLPSYQKEVLSEHLSSLDGSSLPLRSPAQPYLPVYSQHSAKYSFKRDRGCKLEQSLVETTYTAADKKQSERAGQSLGPSVKSPVSSLTTSPKSVPDSLAKPLPYQGDRPTSIGLLRSFDGDTSSSEAGSSLNCPSTSTARTVGHDNPAQGRPATETFNQVSSPLLSTAPDVLPSEVRSVVSESNTNKALNNAPYYYSDIFGDKIRLGDWPMACQSAQQVRVTPNMLNNIRELTPASHSSKDNIGRRVNKISMSVPMGLNVSHSRTQSEPDPSVAELEMTLRGLLNSDRKFSDAERNKYVAGHTLEKTSHMSHSVLSHMCKQHVKPKPSESCSAEPQLDSSLSRATGRMLPRRLSRSLEDIIDSLPTQEQQKARSKTPVIPMTHSQQDEPYYENVGFGSARKAQASPPKVFSTASPQVSPAKHSIYDGEDLCREFVAAGARALAEPLALLGAPSPSPVHKEAASENIHGADCLDARMMSERCPNASLSSLKMSGLDYRKDAGSQHFTVDVPAVPGKRCWSNDFEEQKHQGGLYRHSTDNLHTQDANYHLQSPPGRDPELSSPSNGSLSHSLSAGDLLGKSHEELVLLLIQLRRSQTNLSTCQIQCKMELQELKENIVQSSTKHSAPDVQRLVSLQRSLNELTRNLELTQPLISLVENMVKLGSLYNISSIGKHGDKGVPEDMDQHSEDVFMESPEKDTLEKQQHVVEQEILRIQSMLAENTTSGSLVRDDLELELKRLQKIVDNLLQRKNRTCGTPVLLDKDAKAAKISEPKMSAAGLPERKRHQKTYYETDLDSCVTNNLALASRPSSLCNITTLDGLESPSFSPEPPNGSEEDSGYPAQDISEADDRTKKFYGLLPRDRAQEIKTVRIVKRESERRHKGKDKRKGGQDDSSLVWVLEEPETFFQDQQQLDSASKGDTSCISDTYNVPLYEVKKEHGSLCQDDRSASSSSSDSVSSSRRTSGRNDSRRNKRRHYTISGSHPFLEQLSPSKMPACLRSRDDMDMERCLRTVNTPDIVRSTIKKSDIYDEQMIDMQIGLPQKILIPERYIEVESENVSAVEQLRRSLKAANIRKMLTETVGYEDLGARGSVEAVRSKVGEEKRRRAHLLALSHTIAKEVMERSKMVAAHVSYQENT